MRTDFFHPDECRCRNCRNFPEENFNSSQLLMAHQPPSLRLVGVELEISGISEYDGYKLIEKSKRNWVNKSDGSIPFEGREIVSPPFKTEEGFDKAVEILTTAVNVYGGQAICAGEATVECAYCQGECDCRYCEGDCRCDYCREVTCNYCRFAEALNFHKELDDPFERALAIERYLCSSRPDFTSYEEATNWAAELCECLSECEGECRGECSCEENEGSTGFHVHVDARDLTKEQRAAVYVIYAKHWHEICKWHHISRHNCNYCHRPEYPSTYLLNHLNGIRNEAVNFIYAFSSHGTIEFRQGFLPAANPIFVKHWAKWCRGLVDLVSTLPITPRMKVCEFILSLEEWQFSLGKPGGDLPSVENAWSYKELCYSFEEELRRIELVLEAQRLEKEREENQRRLREYYNNYTT